MKHVLLLFVWILLLPQTMQAKNDKDFVAIFIDRITEITDSLEIDSTDYECVTISPSMIERMLQMVEEKSEEQTALEHILPHVKSLRIFSSMDKSELLFNQAQYLLDQYSQRYKCVRIHLTRVPQIWIRKNRNKVIEMIVCKREADALRIVNLTGDINQEFIDELLKM